MAERVRILQAHLQTPLHPTLATTSAVAESAQVNCYPLSPEYKYTLDSVLLTPKQRQFYEENGFLVIKNLVDPDQLEVYRKRFEDICSRSVTVPGLTIMRDIAISKSEFVPGEKAVTKIQDFQYDDVLFDYCCLPEVIKYVKCFCGPNIMAMHTMLINKPPDPGTKSSRHPMHQDLHYFPFRPAEKVVCSWTAMQTVNRQNGCLVVVPGSHKSQTLLRHVYPEWEGGVNKLYHGIQNYNPDMERLHVEMEIGDTVFFHPLLVHGSGMNKTDHFRKSISCHYASSDCNYIDVHGTIQQNLEDEIKEVAKRKLGMDGDANPQIVMQDVWRAKGRLVSGEILNL